MVEVKIYSEYIKLGQMLKFASIISSGADAKIFLEENTVHVNSVLEQRRGRKLYENDIILIHGVEYIIKMEK